MTFTRWVLTCMCRSYVGFVALDLHHSFLHLQKWILKLLFLPPCLRPQSSFSSKKPIVYLNAYQHRKPTHYNNIDIHCKSPSVLGLVKSHPHGVWPRKSCFLPSTPHSPAPCNSHKTAVQETTKTMVWPSRILGETKDAGSISALQNVRDLLFEMSRQYQK